MYHISSPPRKKSLGNRLPNFKWSHVVHYRKSIFSNNKISKCFFLHFPAICIHTVFSFFFILISNKLYLLPLETGDQLQPQPFQTCSTHSRQSIELYFNLKFKRKIDFNNLNLSKFYHEHYQKQRFSEAKF